MPVAGRGVLLAKAYRPGVFTENDQRLAVQLAQLVEAALDRPFVPQTAIVDGGSPDPRTHSQHLEEVADILSHDLKNPLTVARGYLELAQESGNDEYFEQASDALERIGELVDEVVFLARTGELVERTEPVELEDRATVAWDNVETKGATLDIVSSVSFDASKRGVCHLLENIIENAVVHAGANVTVRVGSMNDGFFVEDDGPGIPDEHRDHLFDRGYTVETDTSGLGLHIVRRIAEAHGWDIAVGTSSSGGARFEVTGVNIE